MYTYETRPEPRPIRSCHQILSVTRDATPDELATAYLRIAMPLHPEGFVGDLVALQARDRLRFREVAEAWAVLSDGMAIRRAGVDPDVQALAVFDQTLAWHALSLAHAGRDADAVLRELAGKGCPQSVAWAAAQMAAKQAALGVRPRPIARQPQAAAVALVDPPSPETEEVPPDTDASLPQRIAAGVADLGLLFVLCVAPILMLGRSLEWHGILVDRLALVALLAGGVAYYVSAELGWSATPGKRLLGLEVVRIDGAPLDRHCVLLRHGLRTLSHCLFGIGFLTAGFTAPRQAVHDLLTGTRVLSNGDPRQELVRALCAAPLMGALALAAVIWVGG
jgi:uncharacterized RDD family membrane protein YckC